MTKPIIVYLDSSDYSVFSDDSAKTLEIMNIEAQLLRLRDEGKIEIRFSHINVIEAAPTQPIDKVLSSKRLQTIKKFCEFKCLASYVSAIKYEIESLSMQEPALYNFNILNENGIWFPDIVDTDEFSDLKNDIKEEVSKIPDRTMRRKAERQVFNADGSIKKNALAVFKNSTASFALEFSAKYPISEKNAKLVAESYFHNGSMGKFVQALSDSLSNLESLGKWYECSWDDATQLSSFLREIGTDLRISLEQIKNHLIEENKSKKLEGSSDIQIKNEMDVIFVGLLNSMPKGLIERMCENNATSISQEVSWELCPSLLTLTTLSVHLAKLNSLTTRKSKTSDFGDILHTAYLPHVDIFRADGNTASIIKQAKLQFKTKVVSKLTDLPNEINNLLMLRAKQIHK